MKIVGFAVLVALSTSVSAQTTRVKPYIKRDGTYVQGHMRTNPNSSTYDNWSTRPNVNPYTGREGTREPYPTYRPAPLYQPRQTYSPPRAPTFGGRPPANSGQFGGLYQSWRESDD